MLRNYLVVAWRNLVRNKGYSLINIAGLMIGLATAVVIVLYIQFELSYDRYHEQADHIFRVYTVIPRDGADEVYAKVAGPLAEFLKNKYAPIEETARVVPVGKVLVTSGERHFYEENLALADPSILKVFSLPLVRGNPATALADPHSLLITEAMAEKYFGSEDPIGKTIQVDRKTDLTVTGILKNIPRNSHLHFGFLASMGSVGSIFYDGYLDDKHNTFTYTYVRLHRNVDPAVAPNMLTGAQAKYLRLQPITRIHLHSHMGGEYEPNSDIRLLYILAAITLLVLLVACINYANLAVALYSRRVGEIALRKVMGSNTRQLAGMFLAESFLVVLLSLVLALALVEILLPWLVQFLDRPLELSVANGTLVCGLAGLAIAVVLLSGVYPLLFVSRLQPVYALKNQRTGTRGRSKWRYGLVLVQFAVFIALVIAALTIARQVRYIQDKDLGFAKEALVVVPLSDKEMGKRTEVLKRELSSHPNIRSATATSDMPGVMQWVTSIWYEGLPEGTQPPRMSFLKIDPDFVKTFEVEVVQGRDFSRDKGVAGEHEYLLNQAAVQTLGWKDPIGKGFTTHHGGAGRIVGVIKDFHFKSLHDRIEPLFLTSSEGPFDYLAVRIDTEKLQETLAFMRGEWSKLAPDSPFEFFFYDAFFDRLYRTEIQFGRIILVFSVLTILIACNGLLGLASFEAEQRTKEIGIRKVLGASVPSIIMLLSKDFARWAALANVIAWPVAWYAMNKWLQNFAYRIELGVGVFVLGGVLALLIAWLTVSYQAIRAARANPVEALRYE